MAENSATIDLDKHTTLINDVLYYMEILIDMQEYCVDDGGEVEDPWMKMLINIRFSASPLPQYSLIDDHC